MVDSEKGRRERYYANRVLELERELLEAYHQLEIAKGSFQEAAAFADQVTRELETTRAELDLANQRLAELEARIGEKP